MNRRTFLARAAAGALTIAAPRFSARAEVSRPNIVLIMADDLGYGDTGFNGNTVIKTPHLDRMRGEGALLTRFYAGAPVCSPTRGTCLTGRHHLRYGINHANDGALPREEITIAEICKSLGYRTGHFGKWHLGTLSKSEKDGNRGGPEHPELYSPPWDHGFDTCFSTEALVPNWDPAKTPAEGNDMWGTPGTPWRCAYWNERGERIRNNLDGDDSRVIVDRIGPFMRESVRDAQPFLAVVWFHTPHAPVVAGEKYRANYAGLPESRQHYAGAITAMDEQIGRLNALIKELGIEDNTAIWFASDNGPEGSGEDATRSQGSTGVLRGRKRSLYNGGIAAPALLKWPAVVSAGKTHTMPCSTLDYLPTIAKILGYAMPDDRPIDGVSLMPLLRGEQYARSKPIPFRFHEQKKYTFGAPTFALMDNQFKLLTNLSKSGEEDECYDMIADPAETTNIIAQSAEFQKAARAKLDAFIESCRASHAGEDYPGPYTPQTEFPEPTGNWKV
ncbi:MAG: sulfatase-like hydrolase/transferase [Candidatus Hydrogenedentes bacterium]|nr:sulfatase-like hydrolase/transferase [Candidatus Hydrogenedentota bacterium]